MSLDSAGIQGQVMTFRHDSAGSGGENGIPEVQDGTMAGHSESPPARSRIATSCVWGIPLANLTLAETVAAISDLIECAAHLTSSPPIPTMRCSPSEHPDLPEINAGAALILADGAPLVWASRRAGSPLKKRVAGSDLIFELSARSPPGRDIACSSWEVPMGSPRRRPDGFATGTLGSRSSAPSARPSASRRRKKSWQ